MAERVVKLKQENAYFDSRPGTTFYAHGTYEVPRDLSADEAERLVGRGLAEDSGNAAAAAREKLAEAERVAAEMRRVVEESEKAETQVDEVPTEEVPLPHGLSDLSVPILKEKAKREGVDLSGLTTKPEILAAFEKKEA